MDHEDSAHKVSEVSRAHWRTRLELWWLIELAWWTLNSPRILLGMLVTRLIEVRKLILNGRGTTSRGPRLHRKGEAKWFWWCSFLIPGSRKQRHMGLCEFEASLDHIVWQYLKQTNKWKRRIKWKWTDCKHLSPSASWLEVLWPSSSHSCHYDTPIMMNCTFKIWAKRNSFL